LGFVDGTMNSDIATVTATHASLTYLPSSVHNTNYKALGSAHTSATPR